MDPIKTLAINMFSTTGLFRLSRAILAPGERFVLILHGIAKQRYPDIPQRIQPNLTTDDLHRILSWLRPRFPFLTPEEYFEEKKGGVLLTFDDGLASNYTNALSLLSEFSAPAIFFVSTQHVKNPTHWLHPYQEYARQHWGIVDEVPREIGTDFWDGMTIAQVKDCAQHPLITIGAHTVTHPHLPDIPLEQVQEELTTAKEWLEATIDQPVNLFAYPYGDYNRRVAEAVREAGYDVAFADDLYNVGLPRYEIPRIGIYSADHTYLDAKLSGLYKRPA